MNQWFSDPFIKTFTNIISAVTFSVFFMCSVMSSVLQTQEDQVTALMEDERRRQQELLQVSISHMIAYCAFKSPDVRDVMWIFKALSVSVSWSHDIYYISNRVSCLLSDSTIRPETAQRIVGMFLAEASHVSPSGPVAAHAINYCL